MDAIVSFLFFKYLPNLYQYQNYCIINLKNLFVEKKRKIRVPALKTGPTKLGCATRNKRTQLDHDDAQHLHAGLTQSNQSV